MQNKKRTLTVAGTTEKWDYLILKIFDFFVIAAVVPGLAGEALCSIPLSDSAFQFSIFLLQALHLVQVGGQAIVEVLHGHLLIAG